MKCVLNSSDHIPNQIALHQVDVKSSLCVYCSSRGLEDIRVSCSSIHSDHSSGITKLLQNYRYTHTQAHTPVHKW